MVPCKLRLHCERCKCGGKSNVFPNHFPSQKTYDMRQRTGRYLTPWTMSLVLAVGGLVSLSLASPTNPIQPVFIQRDLPPAPYAYGLQDFDSSEEVTIVKRAGQTVYTPSSTTHLTTPSQALPTPLAQVQTVTPAQPLQVPLSLQQLTKPAKLPKKTAPQQQQQQVATAASTDNVAPATSDSVANGSKNEGQLSSTSPEQTSLMEVELETAPRPEDLPQPAELTNAIPQKRNVYSKYASQVQPGHGGCGCGGYVLVEKKIYVCEPKETIVRLMKRSNEDVCAAQETQHVGVVQAPDNPEQMFQLIPMPEGMGGQH
uniref:DUF4794 domain-containing protein n=1 Tax=Anopheles christyi TaxID=43041 RepID=A0A182K848_9DIPT